jgi:hypothetical protein
MGWTDSQAYWKTRWGRGHEKGARQPRELRPTELAQMAEILGAKVDRFLGDVARETGWKPPLPPNLVSLGRRAIEKAIVCASPILIRQRRRDRLRIMQVGRHRRTTS